MVRGGLSTASGVRGNHTSRANAREMVCYPKGFVVRVGEAEWLFSVKQETEHSADQDNDGRVNLRECQQHKSPCHEEQLIPSLG